MTKLAPEGLVIVRDNDESGLGRPYVDFAIFYSPFGVRRV